MKKNLLLVIMFVMMFFIGSNDVRALKCEVGEDCLNELKEYIESPTRMNGKLICLYEVEIDDGETYYNYIYQAVGSGTELNFLAGTTLGSMSGDRKLSSDSNAWLLGDAYESFYRKNTCPTKSYIDYKAYNEVCFDNNDGKCKNNGKKLDTNTNFNNTVDSKLVEEEINTDILLYDEITFKNSCNMSVFPGNYNRICRYHDGNGNFIMLLHNGNNNTLLYDEVENGKRFIIDKNSIQSISELYSNSTLISEYKNNINNSISSCPEYIYKNDYALEAKNGYFEQSVSFDFTKQNNTIANTIFELSNCDDETYIPSDKHENCSDLIDGDIRELINDIMNIIRIAVPLLLIGLLTYDVAVAVFAGDDKKVNESKNKAIKRIIIAIVIFFIPTFINVLFDIVNEVWGTNFSTCDIDDME